MPAAAVTATVRLTFHTWPAAMDAAVHVSTGVAKVQLPRFEVVTGPFGSCTGYGP